MARVYRPPTAAQRVEALQSQFAKWAEELGEAYPEVRPGYALSIRLPGLGVTHMSIDAHKGDVRWGVWVYCMFDDVDAAIKVYGDRRVKGHDHLYAEYLNPFTGKFNFYTSGADFIYFETAIEQGIKAAREATV